MDFGYRTSGSSNGLNILLHDLGPQSSADPHEGFPVSETLSCKSLGLLTFCALRSLIVSYLLTTRQQLLMGKSLLKANVMFSVRQSVTRKLNGLKNLPQATVGHSFPACSILLYYSHMEMYDFFLRSNHLQQNDSYYPVSYAQEYCSCKLQMYGNPFDDCACELTFLSCSLTQYSSFNV